MKKQFYVVTMDHPELFPQWLKEIGRNKEREWLDKKGDKEPPADQ